MPATIQNYDRFKTILQGDDAAARITVACDPATPPEVLYFLCDDASAAVRRAVAENRSTPSQADARLARDSDVSVRCALARKAVGEGLADAERADLWRMGFTILETLMRDQVVRVRRVLTETLATAPGAPHGVVLGLARDREEVIAAPVLKGSPVLTDDDMVSILEEDAPDWAHQAIAQRETVSPELDAELAGARSPGMASHLVANPNAPIDQTATDAVLEPLGDAENQQANRQSPAWNALGRLARSVATPLLAWTRPRQDSDDDTAPQNNFVVETAAEPLPESASLGSSSQPLFSPEPASPAGDHLPTSGPDEPQAQSSRQAQRTHDPVARARKLHNANALTDNAVARALDGGDVEFVIEALALRSGLAAGRVRRMIESKSPRTVVALAWKSGLSARFAVDLQRKLAHIQPAAILNARGGIDFALTPAEMKEQLAFFA